MNTKSMNIPEIAAYHDALVTGGKSVHTMRTYFRDIEKFVEFFNVSKISDIQNLGNVEYRKFIGSFTLSPASVNGIIRNIGAFLHFLEDEGYISDCKFFSIKFGQKRKFVKEPKTHKDVLSDDEVGKMISVAKNKQVKFMLALMAYDGLRSDEVRSIKIGDIKDGEVEIHGKGSKDRKISFNPILMSMYNEYIDVRNSDCEYLFFSNHSNGKLTSKSVIDRIDKVYQDAGLVGKHITAHSFRRTAATNIIKESGIAICQKILGHASLSTTQLYNYLDSEFVQETMKHTTRTFGLKIGA